MPEYARSGRKVVFGHRRKGKLVAKSFLENWVSRLKASAREEIQETARSAAHYIVLYGVAAVAALMALVFLTLAAFWWLGEQLSATSAALIITAFYGIVAAIVLIWAAGSGETTEASPPRPAEVAALPEDEKRDMPSKMGVDLDNVARMLSDAGFRTEGLLVATLSEVLRQLTPLQFVSLVFVASFLVGRRLRRR